MKRIIALLSLLSVATPAFAGDPWLGTWVQRGKTPMTMTVEKAGASGAKFTYRMPPELKPNMVMTFETQFDGNEAQVFVDGKPIDEMMVIKRIDDRHTAASWKINGEPAGSSTSELSADGKVIKAESDNGMPGPDGNTKVTMYWDKKS